VKLRNQTESASEQASSFPPLFEYRLFISDGEIREKEIFFSLQNASISGNILRVQGVSVNGYESTVNKTAVWDQNAKGFYLQLFFELWLYDKTVSGFRFQDSTTWIWLNVTAA
jgi:hypothetical protein